MTNSPYERVFVVKYQHLHLKKNLSYCIHLSEKMDGNLKSQELIYEIMTSKY